MSRPSYLAYPTTAFSFPRSMIMMIPSVKPFATEAPTSDCSPRQQLYYFESFDSFSVRIHFGADISKLIQTPSQEAIRRPDAPAL